MGYELYGSGGQSRSFTFVGDVVDATIAAMQRGTGTYNVGGGEEASMLEAIELSERISGRTLDVRTRRPRPATSSGRRRTRRGSCATSAGRRASAWRTAYELSGNGQPLESAPDDRAHT